MGVPFLGGTLAVPVCHAVGVLVVIAVEYTSHQYTPFVSYLTVPLDCSYRICMGTPGTGLPSLCPFGLNKLWNPALSIMYAWPSSASLAGHLAL